MDTQHSETIPTKKTKADIQSGAEAEVKRAFANFTQAIRAGHLEDIMSFYSPDVVAFDMMPPLRFHGIEGYQKTAWKECFTDVFSFPIQYDWKEQELTLRDDVAIFHGLIHMSGEFKESGKTNEAWLRNTTVLMKEGERWFIVHEHNSAPCDFNGRVMMNLPPGDDSERH